MTLDLLFVLSFTISAVFASISILATAGPALVGAYYVLPLWLAVALTSLVIIMILLAAFFAAWVWTTFIGALAS